MPDGQAPSSCRPLVVTSRVEDMRRPKLEQNAIRRKMMQSLAGALGASMALAGCGGDPGDDVRRTPRTGPMGGHVGESTVPARQPRAERRFRAVVALEGENAIAVIEGPPWRVLRRLPAPAGPHNVAVSPDGRFAAVASPPADRVTLLDVVRLGVLARTTVPGAPHDVDFTADGQAVWVTAERAGRVVRLSVPGGAITASRPASGRPHDLAVSPDGRRLWVTIDGSQAMDVRDAATGRLLRRATTNGAPHDLAFEPGGARLWLSNWSSPMLTAVSARTGRALRTLRAGSEPHHFAFGKGCLWASDNGGGTVVRIDPVSNTVRGKTAVGPAPHHVTIAGGQVLVAVHGTGTVAVVSVDGRSLRRIAVGAGPHGIAAASTDLETRPLVVDRDPVSQRTSMFVDSVGL
jgi:DNA-binding beta-propeller fold protein YncE